MQIPTQHSASRLYQRWYGKFTTAWNTRFIIAMVCAIFVIMVALGSIWYGIRLEISGQANAYFERWQNLKHAAANPAQSLRNIWLGRQAKPIQLILDFDFEKWQLLVVKQQEATLTGSLFESDNPWIKGKIRLNGQSIPVKVKLKGGPEHFNSDKWSLRVEVTDDAFTIFGLKSFALQHPKTRMFLGEWLFHQWLRQEDVLGLKYDFVDVIINGDHKGVYALEQHFDKLVPENSARREGPVLVLSEELYNVNYWPQTIWRNAIRPIAVYDDRRYAQDPDLYQQTELARTLIEQFRQGGMPTCDVFDCGRLARYFAILDLLGGQHAAGSGNFKMYYNPVLAKLEPIGYDAEPEFGDWPFFLLSWSDYQAMPDSVNWIRTIFTDTRFMKIYLSELDRMSQPGYLEDLIDKIKPDTAVAEAILYRDYPAYEFNWQKLKERRNTVRKILNSSQLTDSYVDELDGQQVTIETGTVMLIPVEVVAITYQGQRLPLPQPVLLPARLKGQETGYERISVSLPASTGQKLNRQDFGLVYRLAGIAQEHEDAISAWPKQLANLLPIQAIILPTFRNFDFLQVAEEEKLIVIPAGQHSVSVNLVIPDGYTVIADAGAVLDLRNGANFISYSPLQLHGQPNQLVKIISSDGTGGGLAVLQAGRTSNWRYALLDNLAGLKEDRWMLTGAVTFYESPVNMEQVVFSRNRLSDDALNLIRSPFLLDGVTIKNAPADALDDDFSDGEIRRSRVENSGNDAFDFSGSTVVLRDIVIINPGDKGISAGERSRVAAFDLHVRSGALGMASKDDSELRVTRGQINGVRLGAAVYQKKPEFGPARLWWQDVELQAEQEYLIEQASSFYLNEQTILGQATNVAAQVEALVQIFTQNSHRPLSLLTPRYAPAHGKN